MGFDRGVLPKDRDKDETYPWMGLLTIVLIIGGILLAVWLAFGAFGEGEEPAEIPGFDSRGVITSLL
jgi:hypothetical protein